MIIDANLLLYAVDETAPEHDRAQQWLEAALNGTEQVGLPWPSLLAFLRIATHPRASARPLSADRAWAIVDDWLQAPMVWVPSPTLRHAQVLGTLVEKYRITGNLIPDAHLAALAMEHGVVLYSADTDFARFDEVRWLNPLGT